jgi:hypothetical protein
VRRHLFWLLGCILVVFPLTACATTDDGAVRPIDPSGLTTVNVPIGPDTVVTCIKYADYQRGGLSCDWRDPHVDVG